MRDGQWSEAIWCLAGAAGVWLVIKIGKSLAPRLDKWLDQAIGNIAAIALNHLVPPCALISSANNLNQQARVCEESTVEGFNPDRTTIPLLEEVFVPLDLSGALGSGMFTEAQAQRWQAQLAADPHLRSENLQIWDLLGRSRGDRKFRQLSIQAKGGMGKTTLLRHVALIYGQRKHRRFRAPKLIPVLLRLRDWIDPLTQAQPPTLPALITEFHVPSLSRNHPLTPPPQWAEKLLTSGSALVMFDGFDEIPEAYRPQVSHWLSAQMREYGRSVFMITSRPTGFKDYAAQRPTIPIFVNKFTPQQQEDFIRRWYLCQERCCRSEKTTAPCPGGGPSPIGSADRSVGSTSVRTGIYGRKSVAAEYAGDVPPL